jgi:hypothetical protein
MPKIMPTKSLGDMDMRTKHVINHCMRYSNLITGRHNAVVNRVKKAAQGRMIYPIRK